MIMDVGDLLDLTAKKVEEPGWWIQRTLVKYNDRHQPVAACAVGTLRLQAGSGATLDYTSKANADLISEAHELMSQHVGTYLHHWNDEEGRTADEVATAMRDAARDWRIKHGR